MKPNHSVTTTLAALVITTFTGCQMFDAKPAADSGFNRSTAPMNTRATFLQQTWVADAYRGRAVKDKFSAVYVAPVNTSFMEKQNWWQQQSARKADLANDTQAFAQRMRSQFQQAIVNYPGADGGRRGSSPSGVALQPFLGGDRLRLANHRGPGVLVLELALVELVPSKAFWNVSATAAGFVVPGAGFLSAAGRGSIAIEGRGRDGATNEIIATFKDRRTDKIAPVNLGSYTWYHGAEGNIGDWAAEFAELLNTPPTNVVKRPSPVTLKVW